MMQKNKWMMLAAVVDMVNTVVVVDCVGRMLYQKLPTYDSKPAYENVQNDISVHSNSCIVYHNCQ